MLAFIMDDKRIEESGSVSIKNIIMAIKNELQKLHNIDIWSLMLFVLYNYQKVPEYSSISELAYILDERNLLKLCEYFGGQTIKIPTILIHNYSLYLIKKKSFPKGVLNERFRI